MIDFEKYVEGEIKRDWFPMYQDGKEEPIYRCSPELDEGYKGEKLLQFSGYWTYYLKDMKSFLQKNKPRLYIDIGRNIYVKTSDVKEHLSDMIYGDDEIESYFVKVGISTNPALKEVLYIGAYFFLGDRIDFHYSPRKVKLAHHYLVHLDDTIIPKMLELLSKGILGNFGKLNKGMYKERFEKISRDQNGLFRYSEPVPFDIPDNLNYEKCKTMIIESFFGE